MKRFVVLLGLALLPAQAWAVTWHVWPGQSIQTAINRAWAGDVVLVHAEGQRSAIYYESLTLKAGVTVHSDGLGKVIIDGQNADQTVSFTGDGQGMYFGGPGVGFTIDGGYYRGVLFNNCEKLHVEDLVILSDPSPPTMSYAMTIGNTDGSTSHFENITIRGQTEADIGLFLYSTDVTVENLTVRNFSHAAVVAQGDSPTLNGIRIENCCVGVWAWDSVINIIGVGEPFYAVRNCEIGAMTGSYSTVSGVVIEGVKFESCEFGIGTDRTDNRLSLVTAFECDFTDCSIGIYGNDGFGVVEGCEFEWIHDTGMSITNSDPEDFVIGGANPEDPAVNHFSKITGDGIHLGAGACADIGSNYFENVDGTAILVESGNDDVVIAGSHLSGYSGCFQGIRTRGQGTMATIRNCTIQGYNSAVVPPPRAVAVTDVLMTGPMADLGTVSPNSPGNNVFGQNTTDLWYGPSKGQGQNPPPIYAQLNYWGEDPPAAESFGGTWASGIVYDPWLSGPPSPAPRPPDDEALPPRLVVEQVRPNPTHGEALLAVGLPQAGQVNLAVFDMHGRLVKTLLNEERPAGRVLITWDGTDASDKPVSPGVYLWKVRSVSGAESGTLVLIR